jgi:hypothetical protein
MTKKKFFATIGIGALEILSGVIPGGNLTVSLGGLALSKLMKKDSDEQKFQLSFVAYANGLEANDKLNSEAKWKELVLMVTFSLRSFYGREPKTHEIMAAAGMALTEARGDDVN